MVDLNGDCKDDLLFLNGGDQLFVGYQGGTTSDVKVESVGIVPGGNAWTIMAGDIDNDGLNEIMISGFYDGLKVYKRSDKDSPFESFYTSNSDFFAQGSNIVDINNDGWVDVFICDDDAESEIFINDQNGNIAPANEMIDMTTTPASDNSGNYGSTWIDIDNDRDLDLYIAKCRGFVNDATDPRRINALFINDGTNHYTEQAEDYGLKIGWQSWSADFGDIDNDGDLDCYIVNHDFKYQLLIQEDDGKFYEKQDYLSQDITGGDIQGIFVDFDNDGFLDILIGGGRDYLLMNNGDQTFTQNSDPFSSNNANSFAVGDINDDGFRDVLVNYGTGFSGTGSSPDELYINKTNDNNWITFHLQGTNSNALAIGARLELYGAWGVQIRDVKAGQSYGIMNSLSPSFGLGAYTEIDSLNIFWPSGQTSQFVELSPNEKYYISENNCIKKQESIAVVGPSTICPGEEVNLNIDSAANITWSNGMTGASITIDQPGVYYATILEDGCKSTSQNIEIKAAANIETPIIIAEQTTPLCSGEELSLSTSSGNNATWSTGDMGNTLTVTESGSYYADVMEACGIIRTEEIAVTFINSEDFETENDTLPSAGMATLTASGDSILWYDDYLASMPVATGNTFTTPFLDISTAYYAEHVLAVGGGQSTVGESTFQENSPYSGDQFNGGLIFDVTAPFTLHRVTLNTDTPGERRIILQDSNGNELAAQMVNLTTGVQTIELNFYIEIGTDYLLTTDTQVNNTLLGTNSPRIVRNSENVDYPYTLDDIVEIKNSPYGTQYYYYFYNWEIVEDGFSCVSKRRQVMAVVDGTVHTNQISDIGIDIFPNPTSDYLQLSNIDEKFTIMITDQKGSLHKLQHITTSRQIDIQDLPSGTYTLSLIKENGETFSSSISKI